MEQATGPSIFDTDNPLPYTYLSMGKKILKLAIIVYLLVPLYASASVPLAGDPAPDFTLKSLDGKTITLSHYRGSIVVLGLFHICVPCMNQAMEFQKIVDGHYKDVVVIGVNTYGNSRGEIARYVAQFPRKITFPYLIDPDRVVDRLYRQRFMPTVIIIDKKGIIRYRASSTPASRLIREIQKLQ